MTVVVGVWAGDAVRAGATGVAVELAGPVGMGGFASVPNFLARAAALSSSTDKLVGGPMEVLAG